MVRLYIEVFWGGRFEKRVLWGIFGVEDAPWCVPTLGGYMAARVKAVE